MSLLVDVSIAAASIVDAAWARAIANRERLRRRLDLQAVREEAARSQRQSPPWEQLFTSSTPSLYRPDEPVAYPDFRDRETIVAPGDYVFPLPAVGEGATEIVPVDPGYYLVSHWVYGFAEETTSGSPYSSEAFIDSTGFIDALQWGASSQISTLQVGRELREYRLGDFQRANFGTSIITNPPPSRSFLARGVGGVSGPYTLEEITGLLASPPPTFPPSIASPIIRAGFADVPPTGWEGE